MHGRNLVRDRPASISDSSQEYSEHKNVIDDVISTFLQNLSTLHKIWNEWEFGIGNRKVAKDFLIAERGNCRYAFYRRKVVWDMVGQMVICGWNAAKSCNIIYTVYGQQSSVTSIINQMRKDRKNGGNPALWTLNIEHV